MNKFDYNTLSEEIFLEIEKLLCRAKDFVDFCKIAVNAPYKYSLAVTKLSLGFIVIAVVDKNSEYINRIDISDNELAESSKKMSAIKFEKLSIPLKYKNNVLAEAIRSGKFIGTTDWKYLLEPVLPASEARLNQAGGGIGYSVVYPFKPKNLGALIFSYYQYHEDINEEQYIFMKNYTKLVNKCIKKYR